MKTKKMFIAQARCYGEWFDLSLPTKNLKIVRWFINDGYEANHRKRFPAHIWDAFRIKLIAKSKKVA